jgi:hypothetical protein
MTPANQTIEIRRRAQVKDGDRDDRDQDADVAQKETIMTDRSLDRSGPLTRFFDPKVWLDGHGQSRLAMKRSLYFGNLIGAVRELRSECLHGGMDPGSDA